MEWENGHNLIPCNEIQTQPKRGSIPKVDVCLHLQLGPHFSENESESPEDYRQETFI